MFWIELDGLVINLDKITSITKDKHQDKYRINFWPDNYEFPYFVEYDNEKIRDKAFDELFYKISKFQKRYKGREE